MKSIKNLVLTSLLLFPFPLAAQVSNPSIISVTSAPSGACSSGLPNQQVVSTGVQYSCQGGTWAAIGGGSGSGTVNVGTTGQIAYYPANGTAVSGTAAVGSIGLPLTANSTGAATTNLALINTCLSTTGATCYISGTAGQVFYINGPMIQHSNTKLKSDPGVITRMTPTGNPLWENYAYTQAWVTSSGCTWTAGATCTLNFPSHGYTPGSTTIDAYVYAQGSNGYLTAATYSSGASACTNGTQNVTFTNTQPVSFVAGTITVSGNVPTGTVTFSGAPTYGFGSVSSLTGTVASCTGTASFTGVNENYTDPAYSGVFRVISVPDANNLVVQLNNTPLVAEAGPYFVKKADTNLQAENLTLDANCISCSLITNSALGMTSILSGVQTFNYSGTFTPINSNQFGMDVQGVNDFHMNGYTPQTFESKNMFQVYGPASNLTLNNINVASADDGVTLVDMDSLNFLFAMPEPFGGGNLLNITVDGVHGYETTAHCIAIYTNYLNASGSVWSTLDNITIRNSDCQTVSTDSLPAHGIGTGGSKHFGTVTLENIICNTDTAIPCIAPIGTFDKLVIKNISLPQKVSTNSITLFSNYFSSSSSTINSLFFDGINFKPYNAGDTVITLGSGSTVYNLDVAHWVFSPGSATTGQYMITSASTTNKYIHIHDGHSLSATGGVLKVTAAGPVVEADNNYWFNGGPNAGVASMMAATASTTFNVHDNNAPGGWFVSCGGSITCTINSGGGNITNTTVERFIGVLSGSPTFNIYAPTDGYVQVADTYLGHPVGSQIQNFTSTYGIGQMMSNGTAFFPVNTTAAFSIAATVGTISSNSGATNNGVSIGKYVSSTSGTVTVTVTPGYTSLGTGFNCYGHDITTPADTITQTASAATTCTLSGTTVSGDTVLVTAYPY